MYVREKREGREQEEKGRGEEGRGKEEKEGGTRGGGTGGVLVQSKNTNHFHNAIIRNNTKPQKCYHPYFH